MTAEQAMIALCREELCDCPASEETMTISADMLPVLYRVSKKQDVTHIVAAALQRRGLLDSGEFADKFRKQQLAAAYRYERMQYEYERICAVLEAEAVAYLPLKGAVIRGYYPQPWMRTSCDIDILVQEEELTRAVEALTSALGYECREKHYHDVWLFSENDVHLELHFSILENDERLDLLLSQVWQYTTRESGAACRMQPAFFVFHTVAHMCYHFLGGGCGVRALMDLWVLRHRMGYDREAVIALCAACGIDTFFAAAEQLAEVWFSGEKGSALTEDMGAFILHASLYGDVEAHVAMQHHRESGFCYLWHRVFLPYSSMTLLYPVLERHKALLPVMHMRRWCGALRRDKRRKAVRELKAHAAAGERSEEIRTLLDRLKLQ